MVHADYRVPVDGVRQEAIRFVATRPEWDAKTASLDVTAATDRTVELTAVVSSQNADLNGALRCALREHLVGWLQRTDGGRYLPRARVEAGEAGGGAASAPGASADGAATDRLLAPARSRAQR